MSLADPRIQTAKKLHADKSMVIGDICKTLQISRPTLYRWSAVKQSVNGTEQAEGKTAASA
jgi:Helix-turn-helix domain of resolvase